MESDWLFVFIVLLSIFATLLVTWIFFLNRNYGYLESLGIPVIKPFLCFGSRPLALHKHIFHLETLKDHRSYGLTYGLYEGPTPVIVTIDPELIKCIMIKNFECFTDNMDLQMKDKYTTLDTSKGEVWRTLRRKMSPTFTSGKLRGMTEGVDAMISQMIRNIETAYGDDVDVPVKHVFQCFSLDVIASCSFGIQSDAHNDAGNELLIYGKNAFTDFEPRSYFSSIMFQLCCFHMKHMLKYMSIPPIDKLYDIVSQMISFRHQQQQKGLPGEDRKDFLSTIVDLLQTTLNTNEKGVLNEEIITAQGVIFFIASLETTASTLTTLAYTLATNPDIQQRLFEEITDGDNASCIESLTMETIAKFSFLDAVVCENLRMYPPVILSSRVCVANCVINGLSFKKGTRINMPIYASHHWENFFPRPEEFDPDRWLRDDRMIPLTWRPFGGGVRNCIGMRFALFTIKLALVRLLREFRIITSPETNLKFHGGGLFTLHYNNIIVRFEKRLEKH